MRREIRAAGVLALVLLTMGCRGGAENVGDKRAKSGQTGAPAASVIADWQIPRRAELSVAAGIANRPPSGANWRVRASFYEPYLHRAAARYGVEARLLWTIAYLETRWQPERISRRGARGLMQLMPATARRYRVAEPHDAGASVDAAAQYLRDLTARFGPRPVLLLAAYNAGEGTVDAYLQGYALRLPGGRVINPRRLRLGLPPYPETRRYVAQGLAILRRLTAPAAVYRPGRRLPTAADGPASANPRAGK